MKAFLVPALIGVAAALMNYYAVSSKFHEPTVELVQVAKGLKAGDVFRDQDLVPVTFSGKVQAVAAAAVPYSERTVLSGREVPRDLARGDLVLWRDATPPPTEFQAEPGEKVMAISLNGVSVEPKLLEVGHRIGFLIKGVPLATAAPTPARGAAPARAPAYAPVAGETVYVGPFRLLSVGARLAPAAGERGPAEGDNKLITVAVRLDPEGRPDGPAAQLVKALDPGEGRTRRIVALLLDPAEAPASPAGEPTARFGSGAVVR